MLPDALTGTSPRSTATAQPYITLCTHCVMRFNLASATLTTYSGTPGTAGTHYLPTGLVIHHASRRMYVGEHNLNCVRYFDLNSNTNTLTTFAGTCSATTGYANGLGTAATFFHTIGLEVSQGAHVVYITDYNNRVRQIDQTGLVSVLSGSGAAGVKAGWPDEAMFYTPRSSALTKEEDYLYVPSVDGHVLHRIRVMDGFSVIVVGQAGVTTGALVPHEDPLLAKLASTAVRRGRPQFRHAVHHGLLPHCAGCKIPHFLRRAHSHQRKQ
jgi:hypothetical protein